MHITTMSLEKIAQLRPPVTLGSMASSLNAANPGPIKQPFEPRDTIPSARVPC
jgi:hypothetical protein